MPAQHGHGNQTHSRPRHTLPAKHLCTPVKVAEVVGMQKGPEPAQRDRTVTRQKERAPRRTEATLRSVGPFGDQETIGGRWVASWAWERQPGGPALSLLYTELMGLTAQPACQHPSLPPRVAGGIISHISWTPGQPPPKNMGTCDPTSHQGQGLSSWKLRGSQCPDLSAGGLTKQVNTGQGVDWTILSSPGGSRLRGGQPAPGSHY